MPTLPTPTTLRARSTIRNSSSRCRRSCCSVRRYSRNSWWMTPSSRSNGRPASAARSAAGTISGGSETMRGSPSTRCVSFANALRLSFVRAFSAAFATLAAWCFACWSWRFRSIVSTSRRAYQTSRLRASASLRIHSRYEPTAASTAFVRSAFVKSRSRPAISKLAASRFRSHSNGPGNVSSKSLRSKTSARSGEA